MTQISAAAKALSAGFAVTLLQMVVAIFLVAPDGPFEYRYQTLLQHDSHWFANIAARGYETIVPPISHKMMEVSNTAFFPAYPAIAWILHRALGVGVENALLITAQSAAWGFWTYFFLFCERWNLPATRKKAAGCAKMTSAPSSCQLAGRFHRSQKRKK